MNEIDQSHKAYLGDGVYVALDGDGVVLTTEGGSQFNVIYLESGVLAELMNYVRRQQDQGSMP